MRREGRIKTSFELYTFLIAQMQLQPIEIQCALINELITTQKEFIHDVGVLMLLHPKKSIRCMVPLIWTRNFSMKPILTIATYQGPAFRSQLDAAIEKVLSICELFVRFALTHKPKTTTSNKAITIIA